jgi:high-affinity nickel-transport protein
VILLDVRIPASMTLWMEFLVGAVLVLLGARMILRLGRGAVLHAHAHEHGGRRHFHPHVHPAGVDAAHTSHHALPGAALALTSSRGRAPFLVGILHGMAGSAALTVLLLATIPGTLARFGYVLLFATGSILGMVLMSVLVGLPFSSGRLTGAGAQRYLRLAAGGLSLALGLYLMAGIAPELSF